MALFGEKYGERVRTVDVPGFSLELCGGCHVRNTGQIGAFLIEGERGIASGVRRIEASTGENSLAAMRRERETLAQVTGALGIKTTDPAEQVARAEQIAAKESALEEEVRKLRLQLVAGAAADDRETVVDGIKVVAREVPPAPAGEMRNMADALRSRLGSGVVVIGSRGDGNVSLVVAVTKDLTGRIKAGDLVKRLSAVVGGGGGGKADFAQAGGKMPEKLPEALAAVPDAVREQLGG